MSRLSASDYRTVLACALLTLSACEPVGTPSGESVAQVTQTGTRGPGLPLQAALPPASTPPNTVAEKAEIYAFAAGIESAQLAEAIVDAGREPNPARRALLIEALTERLAEVDAHRALDVATRLDHEFGLDLLEGLFATVAKEDPESAIAALARLKNQREIEVIHPLAMLVLEEIRDSGQMLDLWLAAVPETQSQIVAMRQRLYLPDLRTQGFQALTESDPDLVLDRIVTMSDRELREYGIYRVADILAKHDARNALARVEAIQDERLRAAMRYQVLSSWAAIEPMTALRYLSALASWGEVPNVARDAGIRSLADQAMAAGVDPLEMLAFSRQMPIDRAEDVRNAAMQALARKDPVTASTYLHEVSGNWRIGVVSTIASGYVNIDPIAAFQWAQQQPADVEQAVLSQIARKDAAQALDLALNWAVRSRANALTAVVTQSVSAHPEQASELAAQLSQSLSGSGLFDGAIATLAGTWIQRDSAGAIAWLTAPGARLPDAAYQAAARALVSNPARAVALTDRIPPEARPVWIEQVAGSYVRSDLESAVAWIEQHRNDPAYARGAVAVVQQVAQSDSARAAGIFAGLPSTFEPQRAAQAAIALASVWSYSDPVAAADWADGLRNDSLRENALSTVTDSWSRRDPDGAKSWILSKPPSADRDRLLHINLITVMRNELPSARHLDGFSNDQALRLAITNVISNRFTGDPTAARQWLDKLDLSPSLRDRVEASLVLNEQIRSRTSQSGNANSVPPPIR